MNRPVWWLTILVCTFLAVAAPAQDSPSPQAGQQPGGPPPAGGPGGPPPGGPGFGFRMPTFPLLEALDADQDGKLSKEEIENAVAALKTADKDGDGKLSRDEIGWPPAGMGRGRRGMGFGPGGAGRSARPSDTPAAEPDTGPTLSFVERIMVNDKDQDGKVTKDELPDRMKWMTQRLDTNQDGAIDKAEAEEAAKPLSARKKAT